MAEPNAPKRDNVLTRKIGPLPMWAWTSIVLILVIGYSLYKNRQNAAAQAATSSQTDASQVPEFVNQTYTSPVPPSAPGPRGPRGPAGPPAKEDEDDERKRKPAPKTRRPVPRSKQPGKLGEPAGGLPPRFPAHPKAPARRSAAAG